MVDLMLLIKIYLLIGCAIGIFSIAYTGTTLFINLKDIPKKLNKNDEKKLKEMNPQDLVISIIIVYIIMMIASVLFWPFVIGLGIRKKI